MQFQSNSTNTDDLLQAARQLSLAELEKFIRQVLLIQAHRKAPNLPKAESELLIKINNGIPPETQLRFDELVIKRQEETLTQEEYRELLELTDQLERWDTERIKYLCQLASIRRISLPILMKDLNIPAPVYG